MAQYYIDFTVIVHAFCTPILRNVQVDKRIVDNVESTGELLDWIYRNGQNDFQPRNCPSVSVGDFILLYDDVYRVGNFGFTKLDTTDAPPQSLDEGMGMGGDKYNDTMFGAGDELENERMDV